MDTPELILKKAATLSTGPGTPGNDRVHQRIAQLWSAYLDHEIQPEQVALCLTLVSVADEENRPQETDVLAPLPKASGLDAIRKKFKVSPTKTTETASRPISNDGSTQYFTELVNWETDN